MNGNQSSSVSVIMESQVAHDESQLFTGVGVGGGGKLCSMQLLTSDVRSAAKTSHSEQCGLERGLNAYAE